MDPVQFQEFLGGYEGPMRGICRDASKFKSEGQLIQLAIRGLYSEQHFQTSKMKEDDDNGNI